MGNCSFAIKRCEPFLCPKIRDHGESASDQVAPASELAHALYADRNFFSVLKGQVDVLPNRQLPRMKEAHATARYIAGKNVALVRFDSNDRHGVNRGRGER